MSPYEYKTVPLPQNVSARPRQLAETAARMVEDAIRDNAGDGWEFYRMDHMMAQARRGWFGSLFSAAPATVAYNILIFRRAGAARDAVALATRGAQSRGAGPGETAPSLSVDIPAPMAATPTQPSLAKSVAQAPRLGSALD